MTSHRHKTAVKAAHPCFTSGQVLGNTLIFSRPEACQRVLDIWRQMQEQGRLTVFGYMLLEDHLHLIASAENVAAEAKHFFGESARQILELLQSLEEFGMIKRLKRFQPQPAGDPAAQLWQDAGPLEPLLTHDALRAKLDFIHQNPVKRGYVAEAALYRYSSARNYAGQPGLLPVTTDW